MTSTKEEKVKKQYIAEYFKKLYLYLNIAEEEKGYIKYKNIITHMSYIIFSRKNIKLEQSDSRKQQIQYKIKATGINLRKVHIFKYRNAIKLPNNSN